MSAHHHLPERVAGPPEWADNRLSDEAMFARGFARSVRKECEAWLKELDAYGYPDACAVLTSMITDLESAAGSVVDDPESVR